MNQNWIVQSSWIWKMLCKKKNKKKHFFPWNVSIPSGLQHSCCPRRLCMGPMELEFLFFFLETFQSRWGCSIAIVPNDYAWVSWNLKYLLKKLNLKKKNYLFIYFLETFQAHQGCNIADVHDGYATALPGLKCFKGNKIKLKLLLLFFSPWNISIPVGL
jgi:hypothetical protein